MRQGLGHRPAAGTDRVEPIVGRPSPAHEALQSRPDPGWLQARLAGDVGDEASPPASEVFEDSGLVLVQGGRSFSDRPTPDELARGEGDPEVAAPLGLGPPEPSADRERLVEPGGAVVADPPGKQVRLPEVGGRGVPLELFQDEAYGPVPLEPGVGMDVLAAGDEI